MNSGAYLAGYGQDGSICMDAGLYVCELTYSHTHTHFFSYKYAYIEILVIQVRAYMFTWMFLLL